MTLEVVWNVRAGTGIAKLAWVGKLAWEYQQRRRIVLITTATPDSYPVQVNDSLQNISFRCYTRANPTGPKRNLILESIHRRSDSEIMGLGNACEDRGYLCLFAL